MTSHTITSIAAVIFIISAGGLLYGLLSLGLLGREFRELGPKGFLDSGAPWLVVTVLCALMVILTWSTASGSSLFPGFLR